MEMRRLGKTGERLTMVGFGGIIVMNETPKQAAACVAEAVEDRGVNYFDVAPSYGNAEELTCSLDFATDRRWRVSLKQCLSPVVGIASGNGIYQSIFAELPYQQLACHRIVPSSIRLEVRTAGNAVVDKWSQL